MRYPLRVIKKIREAWSDKPLFVRFNGGEWAEGPEKVLSSFLTGLVWFRSAYEHI